MDEFFIFTKESITLKAWISSEMECSDCCRERMLLRYLPQNAHLSLSVKSRDRTEKQGSMLKKI